MMISVGGAGRGLVGVIHHQVLVRLLPVARLRVALQLLVVGAARALLPLTLALACSACRGRCCLLARTEGASLQMKQFFIKS